MKSFRLMLFTLALLTLIPPASLSQNSRLERWQAVADEVQGIAADEGVPGLALVLFDSGSRALISSGFAPDTPLRWGSITKTVTALAALKLAEEGKLDLDASVHGLLPENTYLNPWAPQSPLTTRQLLELSAGLADLSREEWDNNLPAPLAQTLPRQRQLLWPPGLQHSYSNVPPGLTAGVIEFVAGTPFTSYVEAAVLKPLGMMTASLNPVSGLPGGFKADGTTALPYWHMTFLAFGALNASLEEMSRLLHMLLNQGELNGQRLFSHASLAALYGPGTTLAARTGLDVGYGTGMYSWIARGHQFWGHGGDADGYLSRYGLLPQQGRGYLVLINADQPKTLRRLRQKIESALVADLPEPKLPEAIDDPDLASYTGHYYPSTARFNVTPWREGSASPARVTQTGAGLQFRRGQRSETLIPLGAGRFRRDRDPVATVVFSLDAAGNRYLFGELGNYVNTSRCPGFIPHCHGQ